MKLYNFFQVKNHQQTPRETTFILKKVINKQ